MKRNHLIANACLFLLVALFSYTAINKIFLVNRFQYQLAQFPWLKSHPTLTAWTVIASEITTILLLLSPRRILKGFIASLILLSLFTAYLFNMLFTTPNLPCTCGGVLEKLSWPQHIALNLLFIGISIIGIITERRTRRSPPAQNPKKYPASSINHQ